MGDQPAMWKAIGDFLDKIAEDTLLIILGILVVLSGAVGRVPFTDLTIAPGWQIVVGVLGGVVAAVGGLLMLRSQKRKRLQLTKCNFEITSVDHNGDVRLHQSDTRKNPNYYDLRGRYAKKPPDGYSVAIVEFDPGTKQNYRLRKKAAVYDNKTWQARDIYARQEGIQLEIAVAYVGASGEALWRYYEKVRRRAGPNATPSIDLLTDDIVIAQHICVNTRR